MSLLTSIAKGLAGAAAGTLTGNPIGGLLSGFFGSGPGSPTTNPYGPAMTGPGTFTLPLPGGQQININPAFGGAPGAGASIGPQQQAILPGNMPKGVAAALVLSGAIPAMAAPVQAQVIKAPPGYVLVQTPQGPKAILRELAYSLGLKKRRARAPITSRDIKGAYRVQSFLGRMTSCRPKHVLKKGKGKRR